MKLHTTKLTIIILGLLLAVTSWAGFDITRMTTVVDDLSGSYTVTKDGRLNEGQFTGTRVTEFNSFHPGVGENEAVISGLISKSINRGAGQINTLANGGVTLTSQNGEWDVSFTDLDIQVSDNGAELTGTVAVNGDSYDAADLPDDVAYVLRRVFWLTRR